MLSPTRDSSRVGDHVYLWVSVAIALGAVLRFWRLGAISVWADEYNGNIAGINAPNVLEFLWQLQIYGAGQGALQPVLQFLWSQLTSKTDVFWLRSFDAVLSLAIIPVAYALGCRLGGRKAGVLASFCACLSFAQIWHAQSIRPYALYMLLSGLSLLAVFEVIKGKIRWVWVCVGLNLLGALTHWMFVVLVIAESVALVTLLTDRWRPILVWILAHTVWMVPSGVYVVFQPGINPRFEPATISIGQVLTTLIKEDCVSFNPIWASHDGVPPWLHALLTFLPQTIFAVSLLALVAVALLSMGRRLSVVTDSEHFRTRLLVLVLALFLPVGILASINLVSGLDTLAQRYVAYVGLIQYAVMGTAVAWLPRRAIRAGSAVLLLISFGYGAWLFLPAVRTTDYFAAVNLIRRESAAGEFVVVDSYSVARNLMFHMKDTDRPVFFAASTQVVCDVALWTLGPRDCRPGDERITNAIWHVYNLGWGTYKPEQWEKRMREAGFNFESWKFPGMENLVVYRIVYAPGTNARLLEPRPTVKSGEGGDAVAFFDSLEATKGEDEYSISECFFHLEEGRYWVVENPMDALCLLFLPVGKYDLALRLAEYRCGISAEPEGTYIRSLIQVFRERNAETVRDLRAACLPRSPFLRPLKRFTEAFAAGDLASAFQEADELDRLGYPYGGKLREAVRYLWQPDSAVLPFGFAPVHSSDYEFIAPLFASQAFPCSAGFAPADRVLAETASLMGRPELAAMYMREVERLQPDNAFVRDRLKAYEAQIKEDLAGP